MLFVQLLFLCGCLLSLLCYRKPGAAAKIGSFFLITGSAAGLFNCLHCAFSSGDSTLPLLFQLPVYLVSIAAAIHSVGYLAGHGIERSGIYFALLNLTVAAMSRVTCATGNLEFLVAWEIMGLASFGLVCFDFKGRGCARAAWIYLLACQAGSAFLMALFGMSPGPVAAFILAFIGFGLKVGFPLLHVWLPEAHPAAPAPVSALMSGAMIPLGFYGIMRFGITDAAHLQCYGWILLVTGIAGALGGALFAIPQPNLKKLLAYSSIENMGVIAMGFGLSFMGAASGLQTMAWCGGAGALFHIINHALLKGGLFLGAGSVLKSEHTLDMDLMGGLLKRAPQSGSIFIINAFGLSGLPPFNGFISEFLIYMAAVSALLHPASCGTAIFIAALAAFISLALTGGLAAAAYAKAVSAVFLGEPRSKSAEDAVEVPRSMRLAVALVTFLSLALTAAAMPFASTFLGNLPLPLLPEGGAGAMLPLLGKISIISTVMFILTALIIVYRAKCGGRRSAPTWDCGFTRPTARMEYTGTAFAQTITDFFAALLRPVRRIRKPESLFPTELHYDEKVKDSGIALFWQPIFNVIAAISGKLHRLQSGSLHFYILILTVALLAMLFYGLVLVD
jgi:formate hydrogenlyase subunit 3/multisubunit Na+/H+ antiporter MnhD subunit